MADPLEPAASEERLNRSDLTAGGRLGVGNGPLGVEPPGAMDVEGAEKPTLTGKLEDTKGGKDAGRRCPEGFHWSKERKECVKNKGGKDEDEERKCPPGFHWNSNRKECVKNQGGKDNKGKECPKGYHLNAAGECVKNKGAETTGTYNPAGAPDIPPLDGGGGGDSGGGDSGSDGGGDSGSDGGGTSAPAADPNQPLIDAGIRLYFSLWGQVPPAGYVEKLVKGGMNLFEIELNERQKPAFKKTKTYRDEAAARINFLLQNQIVGYS